MKFKKLHQELSEIARGQPFKWRMSRLISIKKVANKAVLKVMLRIVTKEKAQVRI